MADLDDKGLLHTESGAKVPRLAEDVNLYLDRTIVIYGPTGTGKTVITKHIMKILSDRIEQVLVVSPSESSNRAYEGYVDPPFIHYRIYLADPANPKKDDGAKGGLRFLEAIWKRQEMMASIYTRANSTSVLAALFGRLPKAARAEALGGIETANQARLRALESVRKKYATDAGRRCEKEKEVNAAFQRMLTLIYKMHITKHYDTLQACGGLTEDETYSLNYIQFNPRLLLIFDDCAAQLKSYFSKEIFRKLFYQNRHSFITVIMAAQDDTDLAANLRKNVFISFFSEPIVCMSNFERAANKYPKQTKEHVTAIVGDVFRGFRKLAYIRDDPSRQHFYHIQCVVPKPFRFGSRASHELCDLVQSAGVSMDRENPYFDHFKL